jgi:hypothetical protein
MTRAAAFGMMGESPFPDPGGGSHGRQAFYGLIRMNRDDDSGRVVANDGGSSAEYLLDPRHAAV